MLLAINQIFSREMIMKKRFALITSLCVIAIGLACLTPTPAPPPLPTGSFADAYRCAAEHE
ncbi:MAG: hypothetical protein KKC71_10115 [Chloroflexi bacterium]|nr:hypothetical protein [Chloroflexota bacterium]